MKVTYPYLNDTEFLETINQALVKKQYLKITFLN
jgi:hypothetical protein